MIGLGSLMSQKILAAPPVVNFDPDYQAILDFATTQGYSIPSIPQQALQNNLVLALKAAGVWSKLHVFRVYAIDGDIDFATINWKNPNTFQAVRVNSPIFIANQGFQGNGTSASLDTPSYLLSVNQNFNSWGGGSWIYQRTTAGDGIFGANQNAMFFRASAHTTNFNNSRIQSANTGINFSVAVNTLIEGFTAFYRIGLTRGFLAGGDDFFETDIIQSTAIDSGHLRELYRWNVWSNAIHAMFWVGEPIVIEHIPFKNALDNYMNSI
jgi:hypothetical protein